MRSQMICLKPSKLAVFWSAVRDLSESGETALSWESQRTTEIEEVRILGSDALDPKKARRVAERSLPSRRHSGFLELIARVVVHGVALSIAVGPAQRVDELFG
jgi:hypothetical protein